VVQRTGQCSDVTLLVVMGRRLVAGLVVVVVTWLGLNSCHRTRERDYDWRGFSGEDIDYNWLLRWASGVKPGRATASDYSVV
jgi:hypothetical protein